MGDAAATTPLMLTPGVILSTGLELLGFTKARQKKVRRAKNLSRFHSHYSSDPVVYADLIHKLQTTTNPAARIDLSTLDKEKFIHYFFMAIHLLACYPTENEAEATFSKSIGVCDRTWRHWCWDFFLPKIAALKPEVIVWPDYWDNPDRDVGEDDSSEHIEEAVFIYTVDGKHSPIQEPTCSTFEESRGYYSHKFNGPALNYEIAIAIWFQQCIWANGPYRAGKNDIGIFRHRLKARTQQARDESGIKHRGIADKGYRGEREYLSIPTSHDSKEVRDFKARALTRHENFNGRISNFDCMDEVFRHKGSVNKADPDDETFGLVRKHGLCFDCVVVIVQLQLNNGSPLFEV